MSEDNGNSPQRIDKWLFFARVVKSRSLAQALVNSGKVKINGQNTARSSALVKAGDVLDITLTGRDLVLKITAPGTRRGPYSEALLLYDDLSPPPAPKSITPFEQAVRAPGSGRPTKADRRAQDRFRDNAKSS